jgi:CheY-like chemotaxis protein
VINRPEWATAAFETSRLDVLILDMMMPEKEGLDVLNEILPERDPASRKSSEDHPDIKVMAMTFFALGNGWSGVIIKHRSGF